MPRGTAQAATVTLELEGDDARGFLLLARAGSDGKEIARAPLRATALNVHSLMPDLLEQVKRLAAAVDPDAEWSTTAPALDSLRTVTTFLARQLFEGPQGAFYDFAKACAGALPPAQRSADEPLLVELRSRPEHFLPIELLPLFEGKWPDRIDGLPEVEAAAQTFLGFSAVIRRVPLAGSIPQDTRLKGGPLPVAFVRNDRLPGAAREAEALTGYGQAILRLDEPLATATVADPNELAKLLSRRIYYARAAEQATVAYDQVLHFACHCDTDPGTNTQWLLRVGNDIKVGMVSLTAELTFRELDPRDDPRGFRRPPLPLVFMNACDTSTINPASAASFVQLFLDNGNRGFIGTETKIPDQVAARYSHLFYDYLLDGETVGYAMHKAKWDLLRKFKNPLGILYTLYGNPDLAIGTSEGGHA